MKMETLRAAAERRREFPGEAFLVRYLDVEREGELYKLSLQDDAKHRVTALLSGANLWALVNSLSAVVQESRAERDAGQALPFTRAYRR